MIDATKIYLQRLINIFFLCLHIACRFEQCHWISCCHLKAVIGKKLNYRCCPVCDGGASHAFFELVQGPSLLYRSIHYIVLSVAVVDLDS